jgi:hypothetical protein
MMTTATVIALKPNPMTRNPVRSAKVSSPEKEEVREDARTSSLGAI